MCGLAGFMHLPGALASDQAGHLLQEMTTTIAHRGPDSDGHWTDTDAGIALGHRRLAIIDLTAAGHQPMASASGRYMVTYNGEIYNHATLRQSLEEAGAGAEWRGHSDTETMLRGFEVWGVKETLERTEGMFAMALWDRETRRLTLARDRMGEKPLYYGWQGAGKDRCFLFGSELSALRAHPVCGHDIHRPALAQLLRHGHVGEGLSILKGIYKLPPGHLMELSAQTTEPQSHPYWDAATLSAERAPGTTVPADPQMATDALEKLLLSATEQQMMASDVPLGAFLSGGIDSSLVVGLMQSISDRPVHTFSIGFHEARYNEAGFAKEVAAHLGTHHTEQYVGEDELLQVVPKLAAMFSEPFADSSQIPTYMVSALARQHVTVALSGDGGDELFGGYDRYRQFGGMMQKLGRISTPLRRLGAAALCAVPAGFWNTVLEPLRPTPQGKETNGQRLHRLADYAASPSIDALHRKLVSRWRFPDTGVTDALEPQSLLADHLPPRGDLSDTERMMQLDILTYLPDDILAKVDRASMAVALESRAPMLDHRVAEFAMATPLDMKLRDGKSKWLLRQVLYRYVPPELIERPKMGFEVPIGLWLRGPLRDWATALLECDRLTREGYFNPQTVTHMWQQHLKGSHNWGLQLWPVLMFQAWLAEHAPG